MVFASRATIGIILLIVFSYLYVQQWSFRTSTSGTTTKTMKNDDSLQVVDLQGQNKTNLQKDASQSSSLSTKKKEKEMERKTGKPEGRRTPTIEPSSRKNQPEQNVEMEVQKGEAIKKKSEKRGGGKKWTTQSLKPQECEVLEVLYPSFGHDLTPEFKYTPKEANHFLPSLGFFIADTQGADRDLRYHRYSISQNFGTSYIIGPWRDYYLRMCEEASAFFLSCVVSLLHSHGAAFSDVTIMDEKSAILPDGLQDVLKPLRAGQSGPKGTAAGRLPAVNGSSRALLDKLRFIAITDKQSGASAANGQQICQFFRAIELLKYYVEPEIYSDWITETIAPIFVNTKDEDGGNKKPQQGAAQLLVERPIFIHLPLHIFPLLTQVGFAQYAESVDSRVGLSLWMDLLYRVDSVQQSQLKEGMSSPKLIDNIAELSSECAKGLQGGTPPLVKSVSSSGYNKKEEQQPFCRPFGGQVLDLLTPPKSKFVEGEGKEKNVMGEEEAEPKNKNKPEASTLDDDNEIEKSHHTSNLEAKSKVAATLYREKVAKAAQANRVYVGSTQKHMVGKAGGQVVSAPPIDREIKNDEQTYHVLHGQRLPHTIHSRAAPALLQDETGRSDEPKFTKNPSLRSGYKITFPHGQSQQDFLTKVRKSKNEKKLLQNKGLLIVCRLNHPEQIKRRHLVEYLKALHVNFNHVITYGHFEITPFHPGLQFNKYCSHPRNQLITYLCLAYLMRTKVAQESDGMLYFHLDAYMNFPELLKVQNMKNIWHCQGDTMNFRGPTAEHNIKTWMHWPLVMEHGVWAKEALGNSVVRSMWTLYRFMQQFVDGEKKTILGEAEGNPHQLPRGFSQGNDSTNILDSSELFKRTNSFSDLSYIPHSQFDAFIATSSFFEPFMPFLETVFPRIYSVISKILPDAPWSDINCQGSCCVTIPNPQSWNSLCGHRVNVIADEVLVELRKYVKHTFACPPAKQASPMDDENNDKKKKKPKGKFIAGKIFPQQKAAGGGDGNFFPMASQRLQELHQSWQEDRENNKKAQKDPSGVVKEIWEGCRQKILVGTKLILDPRRRMGEDEEGNKGEQRFVSPHLVMKHAQEVDVYLRHGEGATVREQEVFLNVPNGRSISVGYNDAWLEKSEGGIGEASKRSENNEGTQTAAEGKSARFSSKTSSSSSSLASSSSKFSATTIHLLNFWSVFSSVRYKNSSKPLQCVGEEGDDTRRSQCIKVLTFYIPFLHEILLDVPNRFENDVIQASGKDRQRRTEIVIDLRIDKVTRKNYRSVKSSSVQNNGEKKVPWKGEGAAGVFGDEDLQYRCACVPLNYIVN